jgi:hypothetical protein
MTPVRRGRNRRVGAAAWPRMGKALDTRVFLATFIGHPESIAIRKTKPFAAKGPLPQAF